MLLSSFSPGVASGGLADSDKGSLLSSLDVDTTPVIGPHGRAVASSEFVEPQPLRVRTRTRTRTHHVDTDPSSSTPTPPSQPTPFVALDAGESIEWPSGCSPRPSMSTIAIPHGFPEGWNRGLAQGFPEDQPHLHLRDSRSVLFATLSTAIAVSADVIPSRSGVASTSSAIPSQPVPFNTTSQFVHSLIPRLAKPRPPQTSTPLPLLGRLLLRTTTPPLSRQSIFNHSTRLS